MSNNSMSAPRSFCPTGVSRPCTRPSADIQASDGRYSSEIQKLPSGKSTRPSVSKPLGSAGSTMLPAASRIGSSLPIPLGLPDSGTPERPASGIISTRLSESRAAVPPGVVTTGSVASASPISKVTTVGAKAGFKSVRCLPCGVEIFPLGPRSVIALKRTVPASADSTSRSLSPPSSTSTEPVPLASQSTAWGRKPTASIRQPPASGRGSAIPSMGTPTAANHTRGITNDNTPRNDLMKHSFSVDSRPVDSGVLTGGPSSNAALAKSKTPRPTREGLDGASTVIHGAEQAETSEALPAARFTRCRAARRCQHPSA